MPFNLYSVLVASLVTLLLGFAWYHPKVFGTIWIKETGITEEKAKQSNMAKIFGLTIFYSLLLAFWMPQLVIHQMGAFALAEGNMNDAALVEFFKTHGSRFIDFKHGALHGLMSGIFLALPITAINGLFEQKTWKYILVNAGYWMVVMMVMGAIIGGMS